MRRGDDLGGGGIGQRRRIESTKQSCAIGWPPRGIFDECRHRDGRKRSVPLADRRKRGRFRIAMHPGEFGGSRGLEGQSAGEQPVDNDPERIDVGRRRGRFASHLFGRDVCGRTENRSGVCQRVCPLDPRDAEVRDL